MALAAAAANSLHSCPTLCNPRDGRPPGFPVPGILQARTLELVVISFSTMALEEGLKTLEFDQWLNHYYSLLLDYFP